MTTLDYIYWIFALVASVFFGWKAVEIFVGAADKPASWWWYQRWFNFLGSMVGWFATWILIRRYIHGDLITPTARDLLTGFIAFVGVTGHLPFTVYGLISSVYRVGEKVADKLIDLIPNK